MLTLAAYVVACSEVLASASIDGDVWSVTGWYEDAFAAGPAVICRNDQVVGRIDDGIALWKAKFMDWPHGGKLLLVATHTGVSHGESTFFYVVRQGKLVGPLLRTHGEYGGPVFRDIDGDGRLEMLFDNWDWYVMRNKGPTKLLAYKVGAKSIRYYKSLPNPTRRSLPKAIMF